MNFLMRFLCRYSTFICRMMAYEVDVSNAKSFFELQNVKNKLPFIIVEGDKVLANYTHMFFDRPVLIRGLIVCAEGARIEYEHRFKTFLFACDNSIINLRKSTIVNGVK